MRLLTAGLLVRIQPEELQGRRAFCPPFCFLANCAEMVQLGDQLARRVFHIWLKIDEEAFSNATGRHLRCHLIQTI